MRPTDLEYESWDLAHLKFYKVFINLSSNIRCTDAWKRKHIYTVLRSEALSLGAVFISSKPASLHSCSFRPKFHLRNVMDNLGFIDHSCGKDNTDHTFLFWRRELTDVGLRIKIIRNTGTIWIKHEHNVLNTQRIVHQTKRKIDYSITCFIW